MSTVYWLLDMPSCDQLCNNSVQNLLHRQDAVGMQIAVHISAARSTNGLDTKVAQLSLAMCTQHGLQTSLAS